MDGGGGIPPGNCAASNYLTTATCAGKTLSTTSTVPLHRADVSRPPAAYRLNDAAETGSRAPNCFFLGQLVQVRAERDKDRDRNSGKDKDRGTNKNTPSNLPELCNQEPTIQPARIVQLRVLTGTTTDQNCAIKRVRATTTTTDQNCALRSDIQALVYHPSQNR